MVFNLITFLLLLLCLYLAILYQSTAACALFLFLFIDWILELMILLYSRRHLKIELPDIIINDNEANKLLEFHLQAQNTGIFPMPYLRLKWHFTDAFQNKISLPDYYFSLSAKKTVFYQALFPMVTMENFIYRRIRSEYTVLHIC